MNLDRPHNRSIAPVIGLALMVLIVITMAVITGTMLLSFSGKLNEPPPLFSNQGKMDISLQDGNITNQEFVLMHQAGNEVAVENLHVAVKTGRKTINVEPRATGDLSDGKWSAGEELSLDMNTSKVCAGGSSLTIQVTHEKDGSSYAMEEQSIPVKSEGFSIKDGAVVPNSKYEAKLTVLGTGFSYGAGGPNIDIRADVVIGNSSHDPWPGNVNNNGNPRSHTFSNQPAGAAIKVAATGDKNGVYISPRTRWSNASSGGWVYVLRDGDAPPNLAGFGDQNSASSYIQPYMNANDTMDLADNEAIYLFELGNSQTGSAADFQDVVVLATITTELESAAVKTISSTDQYIVCPDKT